MKFKRLVKRVFKRRLPRRPRRSKQLTGGTRKKPGVAMVKSPGEFIPERMFVPMEWVVQFTNVVGNNNFTGSQFYTLYTAGQSSSTVFQPNWNDFIPTPGADASWIGGTKYHMMDILEQFYNTYRIFSSSIKIDIQPNDATNGLRNLAVTVHPLQRVVGVNPYATNPPSNYQNAANQPFAKALTYAPVKTGNKPLYNKITVGKLFGVTKQQVKVDSSYYAPVVDLPENQIEWVIGIHDVGGAYSTSAPIPAKTWAGTLTLRVMFEMFGRIQDYADNN